LAVLGLYVLTTPSTGFNLGDLLVLAGSFMWALQIILVGRYSRGDPLIFTLFEMIPALTFFIPDAVLNGNFLINTDALLIITYLALICSNAAFALQVFGQRYISPAVAAVVFLLEPVAASVFAYLILNEVMSPTQALGASLILISMFIASTDKYITVGVSGK